VAVLLVNSQWAWYGGLGAMVLSLAFTLAIAANVAKGRRPRCHCLGQLYSRPVGWPIVGRNAVLAVGAGLIVQPNLDYGVALLAATAIGFTAAVWAGFRSKARRSQEPDVRETFTDSPAGYTEGSLPIGTKAPEFRLPTLAGDVTGLSELTQGGKPLLLIFSEPGCEQCTALLPEIAHWQGEHAEKLRIAILSGGGPAAPHSKMKPYGLKDVLLQNDYEVAEAYLTEVGPSAVLIRRDGTIGSEVATGSNAISALVSQLTRQVSA
jgi:hypothetical protein